MHMNIEGEEKPAADRFPLHWILLCATVVAILASLLMYFFAREYDFLVEASCTVATHECYVRDCSEGDCPPNEFSSYRVFLIPAGDFDSCTDNTCMNICGNEAGPCTEIMCSAQEEVECLGPLAPGRSAL